MSGREFSGFDVDTVTEAVSQPPLDELRTARPRRRRRSVATVTPASGFLLVALAPWCPLVARPDRVAPADPPAPSGAQFSQFTLTGPNSGSSVRQDGCVVRFSYTGDGGRSWSDWDAARFEVTRCAADTAAGTPGSGTGFSVLGERSYLVTDDGLAHLSTDYGRPGGTRTPRSSPYPRSRRRPDRSCAGSAVRRCRSRWRWTRRAERCTASPPRRPRRVRCSASTRQRTAASGPRTGTGGCCRRGSRRRRSAEPERGSLDHLGDGGARPRR